MKTDYLQEAEKLLIGGLIYFGAGDKYCRYALDKLESEDFCIGQYKLIFGYIKQEYEKGSNSIDNIELMKETGSSAELLAEAIASCSTTSNFKSYVEMLRQRTADRRISAGAAQIYKADDKFAELEKLYTMEKELRQRQNEDAKNKDFQQYLSFLEHIHTPNREGERIYTGFSRIDSCIGGLRKGSISIVGAYPSTGKTTLALNIARNQIKSKMKTVFFSLEMSCTQILERLVADSCSINYLNIGRKKMEQAEKEKVSRFIEALAGTERFYIRDDAMYIEDITRELAVLKPDFAVIDFVQRIRTHERINTRREEIDYISSEIKTAAMRQNCHIMTLSQLARKGEGHKPTMDDLKESGGLTQDNDYIFLLYRPNVGDKSKPSTEAQLTIDKNKYGETGVKDMNFNGGLQRFTEVEKIYG